MWISLVTIDHYITLHKLLGFNIHPIFLLPFSKDAVPRPLARISVAAVAGTLALFVLKSFISTAFFALVHSYTLLFILEDAKTKFNIDSKLTFIYFSPLMFVKILCWLCWLLKLVIIHFLYACRSNNTALIALDPCF